MPGNTDEASEAPLFNYTIASADMRYIEVGERVIYLRNDPDLGLILRGEIPGCGPGCYADLSQIFLEFTMSCEGCRQQDMVEEALSNFGERLGTILSSRLDPDGSDEPAVDRLARVFDCACKSMNIPFSTERAGGRLHYTFHQCPFCENQEYSGFMRSIEMARLGFITLCESILQHVAPEWGLEKPSREDISNPLLELILATG